MNKCESCNGEIAENSTFCQYCATVKFPSTPKYAFAVAPAAGIAVLIIIFVVSLFLNSGREESIIKNLLGFGLILSSYFGAGSLLGRKWPTTSAWTWSALVIAPFMAISLMVMPFDSGDRHLPPLFPLLVVVTLCLCLMLPVYFGAKHGRKIFANGAKPTM